MRRVGEIMEDLGFRQDAPESLKKAFVKNLIRAAYGAEVQDIKAFQKTKEPKPIAAGEQLSFDFLKEAK